MTNPNVSSTHDFSAQLFQSSPDGMFTFDHNCCYTSWNPAMEAITGVEAAAVLGKNAFQIFPFLKEVGQDEFFLKALRGVSGAAPLRKFVIPWTNRTGFIETHFAPYRNQQKEVIGGMAIVRDSHALTQREANNEMFRSIADSLPHMIWVTDDQSEVNYFNQRWYEYTGLDQKTHPADAIDLVHPDDREAITAAAEQSRRTGQAFETEYRLLGKDGNYRWFHAKGLTVLGVDGKLLRGLGTATDIHEQRLAMDSALEAHELFRSLVEQTPFSFQLYDLEGNCVYANPACESIWQISREALKGYNILQDIHAQGDKFLGLIKDAFQGKSVVLPNIYYEPAKNSRGGRARWIRTYFFPVHDAAGKFTQVASVLEDVTSQNSMRERQLFLNESSKVLGQTLEIDDILSIIAKLCVSKIADLCMIDLLEEDGCTLRRVKLAASNNEQEQWLESIKKFPPSKAFPDHPCMQALRKMKTVLIKDFTPDQLSRAAIAPAHRKLIIESGTKSLMAIPLIARGKPIGVLTVICTEQSQRSISEEEIDWLEELAERTAIAIDNATLYQESRQAVVARDTFLSIASHELKTPLTTLQLQLKSIQRVAYQKELKEEIASKLRPLVEETQHGIRRITRLVDDMLDISKIASGKFAIVPESLDLSSLSREVCARLKSVASEGESPIRFESAGPVFGEWDGLRLEQVLTNLIINAYRYGEKSEIVVRTWQDEGHACFSVKDLGRGITEEDQVRIFERFERAVSEYEVAGFGLGLYIAREIVKLHQGSITVESTPGIGSLFTVKLPFNFVTMDETQEIRK